MAPETEAETVAATVSIGGAMIGGAPQTRFEANGGEAGIVAICPSAMAGGTISRA
jgi:hypothetical protein